MIFLQSAAYPDTSRPSTCPFTYQMPPARDGRRQKPTWITSSALSQLSCDEPGCHHWFRNRSGLTQHTRAAHPSFSQHQQHLPDREGSPGLGQEYHNAAPVTDHELLDHDFMDSDGHHDQEEDLLGENMRVEFVGPGSKLYHNYHTGLNGMLVDSFTSTNNLYFSTKM